MTKTFVFKNTFTILCTILGLYSCVCYKRNFSALKQNFYLDQRCAAYFVLDCVKAIQDRLSAKVKFLHLHET